MIDGLEPFGWQVTLQGEPVASGENPWYVTQATLLEGSNFPNGYVEGVTVFTIVEHGDTLAVKGHLHIGGL